MNRNGLIALSLSFFVTISALGQAFSSRSGNSLVAKPLTIKARQIVDQYLADKSPLLKMHAIEVVANTNDMGFMPKVVKLLSDPIVPVRFAAALAIGDTNYMPGTYMLTKLKNDPDMNVRVAAAYSLTKLGDENLEDVIMEGIQSDNQTVKANAALIMGKLGNPEFIKVLHWVLQDKNAQDKAKIQAIESLAMLKDEGIYQKAWALLISKRADDRVMGIKTMGHLKSSEPVKAIKTMLNDDVIEVQLTAAETLVTLGEQIGEQKIIEYFEITQQKLEKNTKNRSLIHAAIGLGYTRKATLERYTPQLLANQSPAIRLYGAQSILMRANKCDGRNPK